VAGILLAIALLMMFVPALLLVFHGWKSLLKNSQSLTPLMLLAFLLYWGQREKAGRRNECIVSPAQAQA
jgi:hypothetical protein